MPKPSSFLELMQLVQLPIEGESRTVRMWRGQSDASWPIHSSAYRRLAKDGTPKESDITYYEKDLLKRATHRGFRELNGRRLSDFDLLARLQHHGAATRLVDATRNVLIALFFCASARPGKMGVLLGLHANFLGGYESQPKEEEYDTVIKNLMKYQHPQTWEPPGVSPRIAAQHSQFLYSAVSSSKKGSSAIDSSRDSFIAIAVSPRLKRETIKILSEIFDIRYVTLFPDIDGFGIANSHEVDRWGVYRW